MRATLLATEWAKVTEYVWVGAHFRERVNDVNEWSKNLEETLAFGCTSNNQEREDKRSPTCLGVINPLWPSMSNKRYQKTSNNMHVSMNKNVQLNWPPLTQQCTGRALILLVSIRQIHQESGCGLIMSCTLNAHLVPTKLDTCSWTPKDPTVYFVRHWELSDRWRNVLRKINQR